MREHTDTWQGSVPGRENNSKCKSPKEKAWRKSMWRRVYSWSEEDVGKTSQVSEAEVSKGMKGWKLKRQNYIMSRVIKLRRVQCACSRRHETCLVKDEGGTRFSGELF